MPRKKKTRSFQATISGVTFRNEDGTDRQDIIRQRCDPGDELILSSEPNNPHGSHAVAVYLAKKGWFGGVKKYQLGYVSGYHDTAEKVFDHIEGGSGGEAKILKILGGTPDKPNLGVVIQVTLYSDD